MGAATEAVIHERRTLTHERLEKLRASLATADDRLAGKACVYVTGSGGRGEMTLHSDLDLFIVSESEPPEELHAPIKSRLRRLDAIVVKAALIEASRAASFPEFSKDGKYLDEYTTAQLCKNLGTPEDDQTNTFTARLLLLLESRPLLGTSVYHRMIDEVVAAYLSDYEQRASCFRPVFLLNDIVRLWKTFCVNYEAFTRQTAERKRAERKLKNYKLKNSRVMTCYSAVVYLLQVFAENQTVAPDDVRDMVRKTPTERLEWLRDRAGFAHGDEVSKLLGNYAKFLDCTAQHETALVEIFLDRERASVFTANADAVGDSFATLLRAMGEGNPLYRYVVV